VILLDYLLSLQEKRLQVTLAFHGHHSSPGARKLLLEDLVGLLGDLNLARKTGGLLLTVSTEMSQG